MNEEELLKEENKIPGEENSAQTEPDAQPEETVDMDMASDGDAETGTAEDSVDEATVETETEEIEEPAEKMLTQSQVNELVGKARAEGRESAMKELYGRYGVNDDSEMNDVFGKGQGYDLLNDEYNALNGNYKSLAAENALLKSGVVPSRWNDVKAILGMKGMDVNVDNIALEMATHPEWKSGVVGQVEQGSKELTPEMAEMMAQGIKPQQKVEPESRVRKLGSSVPEPKVDNEDADVMRMFGLK